MNIITKRTIAVAMLVSAVAAAATPSFAQTRKHRVVQPQPQQIQEPYTGQILTAPGYHNPYECWSDEGNGRFSSCNNGSS